MKKSNMKTFNYRILIILFAAITFTAGTALGQRNITISTSATSGGSWSGGTTGPYTFTPSGDNAIIINTDIQNRLLGSGFAAADVTIVTGTGTQAGNVAFNTALTAAGTVTTQQTFTVNAAGRITVSNAINFTSSASNGSNNTARPGINVTLVAGTSVAVTAAINVSGNVSGSGVNADGGDISVTGPTGIRLTGSLTSAGAGGGASGNYTFNDGAALVTTGGGVNDGQSSASVISGGNITKSGTGTFYLAGANTHTGVTAISAGTLELGSTAALGTTAAGTTVTSGAALDLNGMNYTTTESLTISGTGVGNSGAVFNSSSAVTRFAGLITLGSTSSIVGGAGSINISNTGTITGSGFGLTLGGAAGGTLASIVGTGTGTLTKENAGTWTLSGSNTYTGQTAVNAGTLKAGKISAFSSASDIILANTAGVVLDLNSFNNAIGSLTGGGTTGGNITLGSASLTIGASNSSPVKFAGVISGTGAIIKTGTGTLTLSGVNTYSGLTTVSTGVINIQSSAALGATSAGTVISNGAALQIQGGISVAEAFSLLSPGISSDGGIRSISGNNTITALITLSGSSVISSDAGLLTLNAASGSAVTGTYNLTFAGAGNITVVDLVAISTATLTKTGAGTLTFSATNTYSGTTTINEGILSFSAFGASGFAGSNGNGTLVLGGGTLQYTGVTASSIQNLTLTSGTTSYIDISTSGTTLTLSGANPVSTGSLTKLGAGVLVLSGVSSYTGGTVINAGTLTLGAADKFANSGTITLNGGTLRSGAGAGYSETAGILELNSSSSITLGTGNHTLTFANSSGAEWATGTILTINGWAGLYDGSSSGTSGKIFIGSSVSGLTASQLEQIQFFDGTNNNPAVLLSTGELIADRAAPSGLSYNSTNTFTRLTAISSLSPTVTGSVASYSVTPALPSGLSLNTTTGVISGTPSVAAVTNGYTVTATNAGGSTSFVVTITVNGLAFYSRVSGNWNTNATWSFTTGGSQTGTGIYPVAGDNVIIERGCIVTVNNSSEYCGSLQVGSPGNSSSGRLTFSGSAPSLTVSGAVQLGGYGNSNRTGTVTFTSGSTLDAGRVTIGNAGSTPAAGIIVMTAGGTLRTGSLAVITVTGNSWTPGAGTVILDAFSTLPSTIFTSFYNLTISNSGASPNNTVTLNTATTVTGTLTLSSGILISSSSTLLSVTNTSATAISGGSSTSYISGPVKWNLPSNLASGSSYLFPVGKGGIYMPFTLVNPVTGSGTVPSLVEAFITGTGGTVDATLASLSGSEYWSLVLSGNFTNSSLSVLRQSAITPLDVIAGSTSLTGTYSSLAGTEGTYGVSVSNLIGSSRFFVLASKKQTITTGVISGSPFFAGATVSIPFTITGTFTSGNIFTAKLSDLSGSFTSPVTIGTLTQTTEGTISGTIPAGTAAGTGYKILVEGSNPSITGTESSSFTVLASGIWTGATGTEWNIASNWGSGIPLSTTNVIISSGGNQPVIAAEAVCNNITINSGAKLIISAGATLTVSGTVTNIDGASALELQSDATGTGSLIHNTDNVQATVNRYISGSTEAWHLLSSPVSDQSISGDWLPSGTYGNGTGYDLYMWDESTNCWIYKLNTTATVNWNTAHPSANFVVGRGYLYSVQAANPVKQFTGSLNNGNQSFPLTANSTNLSLTGFNLVGNPYPSSVDWQAATGWSRSSLKTSNGGYDMWIWNPVTNNYGVINSAGGTGTNGVSRYIAPTQGFFVRAESNGNLDLSNSLRVQNGAGLWLKKGNASEGNMINISVNSAAGVGSDEVQLILGSKQNEPGAMKLFSPVLTAPSLYMSVQEENFTVRYFTDTVDNPVVPVMFKPGKDGEFTLKCTFDIYQYETLILEDRQLHKFLDLKSENEYKFNSSKTDVQSRFILHFTAVKNSEPIEQPASVYTSENQLIVDLTAISAETEALVYDLTGRILLQTTLHGETYNSLNLNSKTQILIVCLRNQMGVVRRKLMWVNL